MKDIWIFFSGVTFKWITGLLIVRYVLTPLEPWVRKRARDEQNTLSRFVVSTITWFRHHWGRHEVWDAAKCPKC